MFVCLTFVLLRFSGAGTLSCGGSLFGPPRCGQPFAGLQCEATRGCSTLGWLQLKWILKGWPNMTKYDIHKNAVALHSNYIYKKYIYSWAFAEEVHFMFCLHQMLSCFFSPGLLWKNVWEAQVVTWLQSSWQVIYCFHQITILPWVLIIYHHVLISTTFWAKQNRQSRSNLLEIGPCTDDITWYK